MLGGDDIYSGSKACCEILINSYKKSFFQKNVKLLVFELEIVLVAEIGQKIEQQKIHQSLFIIIKLQFYEILTQQDLGNMFQSLLRVISCQQKNCVLILVIFFRTMELWTKFASKYDSTAVRKNYKKRVKFLIKNFSEKNDKRFQNKKFKVFESKYLEIDSKKLLKN